LEEQHALGSVGTTKRLYESIMIDESARTARIVFILMVFQA
jgi:hypothetical protein